MFSRCLYFFLVVTIFSSPSFERILIGAISMAFCQTPFLWSRKLNRHRNFLRLKAKNIIAHKNINSSAFDTTSFQDQTWITGITSNQLYYPEENKTKIYVRRNVAYNGNLIPNMNKDSDWKATFIGTGSMYSSKTRGVSSLMLERGTGEGWLFDCGEGTQLNLQKCQNGLSKIKKVFITHLHGDHCLGLPSLISFLTGNRAVPEEGLDIYGPEGLFHLLKTVFEVTQLRRLPVLRVHELRQVPLWYPDQPKPQMSNRGNSDLRARKDTDIFCQREKTTGTPFFNVLTEDLVSVMAVPMQHTVPTVAYIIKETIPAPNLNRHVADPFIARNFEALKEKSSLNGRPLAVYKELKRLKKGEKYIFPDGTSLAHEDIVLRQASPRVVVFAQDTSDTSTLKPFVNKCDLLVHEATVSEIPGELEDMEHEMISGVTMGSSDDDLFSETIGKQEHRVFERSTNSSYGDDIQKVCLEAFRKKLHFIGRIVPSLQKEVKRRGHSTAYAAAKTASRLRAKQMALTHFSQRYKGDAELRSVLTARLIELHASYHWARADGDDPENAIFGSWKKQGKGFNNKRNTVAAYDGLTIPIYRNYSVSIESNEK